MKTTDQPTDQTARDETRIPIAGPGIVTPRQVIADAIGVSRTAVFLAERRAVKKLARELEAQGLDFADLDPGVRT